MFRLGLIAVLISSSLFGGGNASFQPLFTIERSSNENVVHYDAKLTGDGRLDAHEPVVAYWIMGAKDGRRQELNFLEKTKAYGLVVEPGANPNSYRIALISEKHLGIQVYRDGDAVRAETTIDGHRAYLSKIYVGVRKGSLFGSPDYIELKGTDITTGESLHETIVPRR